MKLPANNRLVITSFIVATLITACSSTKPIEKSIETFAIDFSKYADEGFIITPYEYKQQYLGVGEISVVAKPGQFYLTRKQASDRTQAGQALIRIGAPDGYSWYVEPVSIDEAVAELVSLAKGMKADGIMALKIDFDLPEGELAPTVTSYLKRTIIISGFAFRKAS